MNFKLVDSQDYALFYQDPDGALQPIQNSEILNINYVKDRLDDLGLSYKIFRWLADEAGASKVSPSVVEAT